MLVQTYFPNTLAPARYDYYLASGWFRGSVMLYKMELLCLDNDIFSVVNIRLNTGDFEMKKRHRKLFKKNNKKYTVKVSEASISSRKEDLYEKQKHKFKGFIHSSLSDFLHAGFMDTVFDTKQVEVYDGEELVAVSYFDVGFRSMASLLCLYDKDYSKDSLGIFTMLHEVEYAKDQGIHWYYPGYVLDKSSSFDYKLGLGEYEFYHTNKKWLPFSEFDPAKTLGSKLMTETRSLSEELNRFGLKHKMYLYPFFSMGFMNSWDVDFLRYPVFLHIDQIGDQSTIVVYCTDEKAFKVLLVDSNEKHQSLVNIEISNELAQSENYFRKLIATDDLLLTSSSKRQIAEFLT
ncbi:GNAT family N-acetyltransferase [Halocola ammonii]